MSKKKKLIPEMRFREFKNEGEWDIEPLGNLSDEIVEKTKGRKYKLMSITSGTGLVSQIEKFGREIAGDSYKNYYVIHKGDFAYNKSATKLFGEGEIAIYDDNEIGAVPNSIFTCFRFQQDKIYPLFAKYPFVNNLHGNWLKKFIAIGARANGALQVNVKDLFSLPFPYPTLPEQQKIASCLLYLDDLIKANKQKMDLLKDHKKGLMQNLFPQEGENVPKYRFTEFEKDGTWIKETVGDVYDFKVTNSFAREYLNYENGTVKNIHYGDIHTKFNTLFDITREDVPFINPDVDIKKIRKECYCNVGDIVFADASEDMNDVGKSIEIVNLNKEKLVSGLHTLLARQKEKKLAIGFGGYLFKSDWVRKQIQREAQGAKVLGISATRISNVQILYPKNHKEQEAISLCLSSLDEIITSQTEKIKQLKKHKKGLIQGLFPKMID